MRNIRRTGFLVLALANAGTALAEPEGPLDVWVPEVHRKARSTDATAFDKWVSDTFMFTLETCRSLGGMTTRTYKSGPYRAGTFSFPDDREREPLCRALVEQGLTPTCTHSSLWGDRKSPAPLPRNYLQFERADQLSVGGGLNCHLMKNPPSGVKPQFFVPDSQSIKLEWAVPPRPQQFMTATGPQLLNAGTLRIEIPLGNGMPPYREVRTAVLPMPAAQ